MVISLQKTARQGLMSRFVKRLLDVETFVAVEDTYRKTELYRAPFIQGGCWKR
jgi:hypothetical protein